MAPSEGEKEGQRAFTRLRPLCTQLLDVSSTSPEERAVVLNALQKVLENLPSEGLQSCMDYVLFPLFLLLDRAVACRSSRSSSPKIPEMMVGDKVAEGVLSCIEVVLQKCRLDTTEQLTMLMRKLIGAAMLTASEASEEFRHSVVKCFSAFLKNLRPRVRRAVSLSPLTALEQDPRSFLNGYKFVNAKLEEHDETTRCPLEFLQSESLSAAIGHLISVLIQIAEAEVARGGVGSGKLRRDALSTLRTLIMKVGSADALAFFLPGVVSGFTKVMRGSSKAYITNSGSSFQTAAVHISGAAGWSAAVEEAVRGVAEILALVLGDENNRIVREVSRPASSPAGTGHLDQDENISGTAAMSTLQGLSAQLQKSKKGKEAVIPQSEQSRNSEIGIWEKQQTEERVESKGLTDRIGSGIHSFRVERSREWLNHTATSVNKFLSQILPLLCAHQSPSVRLAVVEATTVLLATCGTTLKICTPMFLECLLALACDDWEHVASAAQTYLTLLMGSAGQSQHWSRVSRTGDEVSHHIINQRKLRCALVTITSSLLDRLPMVLFSGNISMTILHARRLAAAMYFLGSDGTSSCLLQTPVARQKFTAILTQCLSFNTAFTGSLDQITSSKPITLSAIVSEIHSDGTQFGEANGPDEHTSTTSRPMKQGIVAEEIPSMPPWLSVGNGSMLYRVLADILRLAGLSAVTDHNKGTSMVGLMELLLSDVRQAALDLSVNSSGSQTSGKVQRVAATSACVLNEIIYGASGQWNAQLFSKFGDHFLLGHAQKNTSTNSDSLSEEMLHAQEVESLQWVDCAQSLQEKWQTRDKDVVSKIISECASDILHDYLATEVWDLPTDLTSAALSDMVAADDLPSIYFFQDNAMLQKVLVEGVGVLGMALGKAFEEGAFLGLVLFPVLEKLASSSYHISRAAAISLTSICSHCQYSSVKDLLVANIDLVVDSLCRQFRHLDMHPNAPNLLAAILRHTNAAPDLLPLLEEPLRGVVLELEVAARQIHPHFTVPLLRALREITRAARIEGGIMFSEADTAVTNYKTSVQHERSRQTCTESIDDDLEEQVNRFSDRRRHRQSVGAVAASCVIASGPLLASKDPQTCLLALETIEDGIRTLSSVEHAGIYENKVRQSLESLLKVTADVHASMDLMTMASKDEIEKNKLLPTMHQIWPFLVICLRHHHTAVVVRTLDVIASLTKECGGDFFTRRIQKDAMPVMVGLLHDGSFSIKAKRQSSQALLVPHKHSQTEDLAPAAVLKVQEAVLKSVTAMAATKKSASALTGSFSLIAAWVVVLACQIETLREAATNAALALSTIDPDFVWILVADLVHGPQNRVDNRATPPGFPSFSQILPPWESQGDSLWMQHAAYQGEWSHVDQKAARSLLAKLDSSVG